MSTFPPKKANKAPVDPSNVTGEHGPVSKGSGGINFSLKVKAAGSKDAPGKEKTVQQF